MVDISFGRTTMSIPHHSYEVRIPEGIIELAKKYLELTDKTDSYVE